MNGGPLISVQQLGSGFVYSDTYCILVIANHGISFIRIKNEKFFFTFFISLRIKNAVFNVFWFRIKNVKTFLQL